MTKMKLNHLNLTVTDVQTTRKFLETYFGLESMAAARADDNFCLLTDANGMAIALMSPTQPGEVKYPPVFHIGFMQDSEAKVNEIHQRLKDDGFDVRPPHRFHGSWTFYFQSPGGFLVEVLH